MYNEIQLTKKNGQQSKNEKMMHPPQQDRTRLYRVLFSLFLSSSNIFAFSISVNTHWPSLEHVVISLKEMYPVQLIRTGEGRWKIKIVKVGSTLIRSLTC